MTTQLAGPRPWHTLSVEEAVRLLGGDSIRGLTAAEAKSRRARYGRNTLAAGRRRSPVTMLAHQFQSLVVALLVAAGGIALALGERIEATAILLVIILNAIIGMQATDCGAPRPLPS